ncbi:MAG: hypothetical protein KGH84_07955, partial [Paracoccaceae bacterium]|nr:hypothetical protein [Paracoccaceae bacterium]
MDWRTYDHYAYAAMAVLGTALAVVVLNWLMVSSPYVVWVASLRGVASPFTNVVGVLFGLTVAFLSNDTWTAHDRARSSVLREADALRSLDILASGLEGATRARLKGAIATYAAASAGEWPALSRC